MEYPWNADNGGGMSPEKMRHCMSLGYSAKSKLANTIGQCKDSSSFKIYVKCACVKIFLLLMLLIDGNGFKTSTMRLGADVIVFSRCRGKDGMRFAICYHSLAPFSYLAFDDCIGLYIIC